MDEDKFEELMAELRLLKKEMELRWLREVEERTVFIRIHFEFYPISCEILGQMFSGVVVESIDRFEEGDQFHSRIRFPNRDLAVEAFKWFNGRCIYPGCCQLDLFLESTLRAHSSSNLGEDGVVEEMGGPNQGVAEYSVELPQSSDETKNEVPIDVCQEKDSPPEIVEVSVRQGVPYESSNFSRLNLGENKNWVDNENQNSISAIMDELIHMEGDIDASIEDAGQESDNEEAKIIQSDQPEADSIGSTENSAKDLSLQESCKSMVDIIEQMRGTLREMADELRQWREEIEAKGSIDVESPIEEAEDAKTEASIEEPNQEIEEVPRELQIQFRSSEVNSYLPNPMVVDIVWKEREELVDDSTAITDFRMKSIACLGISNAYKVFAEMPRRVVGVFDPGIADSLCIVMPKVESEETKGSCIANSLDNEVNLEVFAVIRMISFGCFRTLSAHNLFVELPMRDVEVLNGLTNGMAILSDDKGLVSRSKGNRSYPLVFDPGGGFDVACDKLSGRISEYLGIVSEVVDFCVEHNFSYPISFNPGDVIYELSRNDIFFDKGKGVAALVYSFQFVSIPDVCFGVVTDRTFVFDPGVVCFEVPNNACLILLAMRVDEQCRLDSCEYVGYLKAEFGGCIAIANDLLFVFDPGIPKWANGQMFEVKSEAGMTLMYG